MITGMSNIHVIGVGGTGGWLMNMMMPNLSDYYVGEFSVEIWDPDVVEFKNVVRQPYEIEDIGGFKVTKWFRDNVMIHPKAYFNVNSTPLIGVICIDNMEGRRMIIREFIKNRKEFPIYVLDSGNEDEYGQVFISKIYKDSIKCDEAYLDFLNQDTKQKEISCADLGTDQSLTINFLQASVLHDLLQSNLEVAPSRITTGINIVASQENYVEMNLNEFVRRMKK